MNYKDLIGEEIKQKFEGNPLFWSVEPDLQFWLAHKIHENLEKKSVAAEVADFESRSTYNVGYKEFLDDIVAEKSEGKEIKRVITEVTFADKKKNSDRRKFDIGVLKDKAVEIILNGGTKNYRSEDFEALFELKFVKNDHYYQLFNGQNGETDYSGMRDFWKKNRGKDKEKVENEVNKVIEDHVKGVGKDKGGWKDDYNLLKDIYKLQEYNTQRHVILLSNYDIFYSRDASSNEELTDHRKNKERINRIVGKEIHSYIEQKAEEQGINFHYYTPHS